MKDYTSGKKCPACGVQKALDEFYRRNKGGPSGYCKKCIAEKDSERRAARRAKNGPKIRAPVSDETRRKMSEAKRKWNRENPDKLPWRVLGNKAFKSVPCEKLKDFLTVKGIQFVAEYPPNVGGRAFSLDIAFPDKLIAIEVNGNQHYERDGRLKPYYQERHDLLEANGWKVYELHYSICYRLAEIESMIPAILASDKKVEFDYLSYKPMVKKEFFCSCGQKRNRCAKMCRACSLAHRTMICPLSIEELSEAIERETYTSIGKRLGVSCNTVSNWAVGFGLATKREMKLTYRACACGSPTIAWGPKRCPSCIAKSKCPKTREETLGALRSFSFRGAAKKLDIDRRVLMRLVRDYKITKEELVSKKGPPVGGAAIIENLAQPPVML